MLGSILCLNAGCINDYQQHRTGGGMLRVFCHVEETAEVVFNLLRFQTFTELN